jgi:Holliday junction resolvase RusA-like endonuclease
MDAQDLIDSGAVKVCGCGRTLIPKAMTQCRTCLQEGRTVEPVGKPASIVTAGGEARIPDAALGGLSTLPEQTLWLVVHGKPKTQGSMRALAAGVVAHADSKALHAWRDAITREALRATGSTWRTVACPVQLDVVFTLPMSKTLAKKHGLSTDGDVAQPVTADHKPDVDKLLRAVQDALSPREKKGERRFHLIDDDSRIVGGSQYKTYPTPYNTHPWALDRPGAVIRVTPVGVAHPTPSVGLSAGGAQPPAVASLHQAACRRGH